MSAPFQLLTGMVEARAQMRPIQMYLFLVGGRVHSIVMIYKHPNNRHDLYYDFCLTGSSTIETRMFFLAQHNTKKLDRASAFL